jgi:hypothetical protein
MIPDDLQPKVEHLFYEEIGRFLCLEPNRRIIAQELYFDRLRPYVETPDLLVLEPGLIDQWRNLRPEIHKLTEGRARASLSNFDLTAAGSGHDKDRLLLRMAACRRLDAWLAASGERTMERPQSFGGDLYWTVEIPGYERLMKVGHNIMQEYRSDPRHDAELRPLLQNEEALTAVEFALFPLAGRDGLFLPDHWRKIRSRWREVSALREHDATSDISVFAEGYMFTKPKKGIVLRVSAEFIKDVDPMLFQESGLCPWLPAVTADFIRDHQHEFKPVADNNQVREWIARAFLSRARCLQPESSATSPS